MLTEQEDTCLQKLTIRDRRTYLPNLKIENFDLSEGDLELVFMLEKL